MGLVAIGDAVVELGDGPCPDQFRESSEAAQLLRNRDRKERFTFLGSLGDEAQTVEVHVGAARDGNQRAARPPVVLGVLLQASKAERSGRLEDAARVLKDVLDRSAH